MAMPFGLAGGLFACEPEPRIARNSGEGLLVFRLTMVRALTPTLASPTSALRASK